jgi:hypothetical protein
VVFVEVNAVGAVGAVCTAIAKVTPPVVVVQLVLPMRRTQYVVAALGLTAYVAAVDVTATLLPTVAPVPHW